MSGDMGTGTRRVNAVSWALLALAGAPLVFFGAGAMLFGLSASDVPVGLPGGPDAVGSTTGVPWDEVVADDATSMTLLRGVSRVAGLAFLGFGLLVITLAVLPYRHGERWAWFALWVVPAFMAGLLVHELDGDFVQMPAVLLAVSLGGLLLPVRAFFPRR